MSEPGRQMYSQGKHSDLRPNESPATYMVLPFLNEQLLNGGRAAHDTSELLAV